MFSCCCIFGGCDLGWGIWGLFLLGRWVGGWGAVCTKIRVTGAKTVEHFRGTASLQISLSSNPPSLPLENKLPTNFKEASSLWIERQLGNKELLHLPAALANLVTCHISRLPRSQTSREQEKPTQVTMACGNVWLQPPGLSSQCSPWPFLWCILPRDVRTLTFCPTNGFCVLNH